VHISARADYAVRAALALAARHPATLSAQALADEQGLPRKFLETVLADLRRADVVRVVRGRDGGYQLARDPAQVAVATIPRAVDGPLAELRGMLPGRVRRHAAAPGAWQPR